MIELLVNGRTIVIPKDSNPVREVETSIFDRELKATDFTYPTEIPLDDNAKLALGLPHILANPNLKKEYPATLTVSGMLVYDITLRLLKVDIRNEKALISIIGDFGSFARIAGDLKVNQLQLDGARVIGTVDSTDSLFQFAQSFGDTTGLIRYTGCNTALHMKDVEQGTVAADYRFPMVADKKAHLPFIHTEKPNIEVESSAGNWLNWINPYFNDNAGNAWYRDPVKEYIEVMLNTSTTVKFESRTRMFWVPMFKVAYVIRKCFEELGFTVTSNLFSDFAFTEVVLMNTYAINYCHVFEQVVNVSTSIKRYEAYITHDATIINPRNHVPDMKITEFLAEIGKAMNLQYNISVSAKTVNIRSLSTLVPAGNVIDLSKQAAPKPVVNYEGDDFNNGYAFSYEYDPNNDASGDSVKDDITQRTILGTVPNYVALAAGAPPLPFPTPVAGNLVYVAAENIYMEYSGSQWDFYAHNVGPYATSDAANLVEIKTKVNTAPMERFYPVASNVPTPGTFIGTGTVIDDVLMPFSSMGIQGVNLLGIDIPPQLDLNGNQYYANGIGIFFKVTSTNKPTYPIIINALGFQRARYTAGGLYPLGSSTNVDAVGSDLALIGCTFWNSPTNKGLYPKWWKGFADTLKAGVQVDYDFLMDIITYSKLDINRDFILIDSNLYLCIKGRIPLDFPSTPQLTLVRI